MKKMRNLNKISARKCNGKRKKPLGGFSRRLENIMTVFK
jgi:hypothetical protein